MQEKKNTPKIIVCVREWERERERGREKQPFCDVKLWQRMEERITNLLKMVWIWKDKIKENEWKDE